MSEKKVKRTESVKIRLTPEERKRLDQLKTRPELARWIREFLLEGNHKKKRVIKHVLPPELIRVMAGIGNNLNQIAKILNQQAIQGDLDLKSDYVSILLQLEATEQALNNLREILRIDRSKS